MSIETSIAEDLIQRSAPRHKIAGMEIFEIDPLQDPRWSVLTENHPAASVFHSLEWLQALKTCYAYTPFALTLSSPASPLRNALLCCEVRSGLTGNRLVSVPFSDHCEPLVNNPAEMDALLTALMKKVSNQHYRYLEIRPILRTPFAPHTLSVSRTYYSHRRDLRGSEQELFRSFHKNCVQRRIERAERESLRYEQGTSDLLLNHFYRLLLKTRRRQGLPPQPLKWFRSLTAVMGQKLKIWVALKGDVPVASILTITHKRTLVYKYGCSDIRFNNLGATPWLLWKAIQDAKAGGAEKLDMGRSDTDQPGLIAFKEHWGAERSTLNYWHYPVSAAAQNPEGQIEHLKSLISMVPDAALVMLGNLLYRHIG